MEEDDEDNLQIEYKKERSIGQVNTAYEETVGDDVVVVKSIKQNQVERF